MNKKDLVMLIMAKKTLDYQKDPNPDNWVTISGAKVHLDEGGKIDGGAKGKFNGKSYSGTKKSRKSGAGTGAESSKKYESKAREAVEYWVNTHYKNPSDKNIKDSVESVRMQMESMVKSAERNLKDAKKTGKEDLIKKYQDKFDEAKGTLEALNNYYDGGTVKKEPEIKTKEDALKRVAELYKEQDKPGFEKNPKANEMLEERARLVEKFGITYSDVKKAYEGKPEVGDKGMAFLKRMSVINSSFEEDTGFMARDIADKLKEGKSLKEIKDYFYDNIDKHGGSNKAQEKKDVDKFIEAVKRADKGLDPWGKDEKGPEPKEVTVKTPNGITLRWQEVPGEPDKVYNPELHVFYPVKGGLKAAIEKAKSQGATVEEYKKEPDDPYQAESKNRQDRRLARSASAQRRAGRSGRPNGSR